MILGLLGHEPQAEVMSFGVGGFRWVCCQIRISRHTPKTQITFVPITAAATHLKTQHATAKSGVGPKGLGWDPQ